jgi:hypothetical protein
MKLTRKANLLTEHASVAAIMALFIINALLRSQRIIVNHFSMYARSPKRVSVTQFMMRCSGQKGKRQYSLETELPKEATGSSFTPFDMLEKKARLEL